MKLSKVDAIVKHSVCIITLSGRGAAAVVVLARMVLATWLDVGVSVMLLLVLGMLVSLDLSGGSKVVTRRGGKIAWILGQGQLRVLGVDEVVIFFII